VPKTHAIKLMNLFSIFRDVKLITAHVSYRYQHSLKSWHVEILTRLGENCGHFGNS